MRRYTARDFEWAFAWAGGSAMSTGLRVGFVAGLLDFLGVFAVVVAMQWIGHLVASRRALSRPADV
jgi:hypothetical protein